MTPPDLGGGERRSRRPKFFSFGFFVILLLFSSPFSQSTPKLKSLGDSDSYFRVCFSAPLIYRAASELHRCLCVCLAVSTRPRSEFNESLSIYPKYRSESFLSPSSWVFSGLVRLCPARTNLTRSTTGFFASFVRLCSPRSKPKRSTNELFSPFAPSVVCAKGLSTFDTTGDCKFSRCALRQGRYYFPTPFVPNLASKFLEDIGVLHGGIPVMVEIFRSALHCQNRLILYKLVAALHSVYLKAETILGPSIPLYPGRMFGRSYPIAFRIFSRLRVTQLTGIHIPGVFSSTALEEPFSELPSQCEATNFTDSTTSVTNLETYRKQGIFQATARSFQGSLGRTDWILGHGPRSVRIGKLFRMGIGPNIKTIQKTNSRSLEDNYVMYGPFSSFYAYVKRGLGCRIRSLDSYSPKM